MIGLLVPVAVSFPVFEKTVYEVIDKPPFEVDGVNEIEALFVLVIKLATPIIGAVGTVIFILFVPADV